MSWANHVITIMQFGGKTMIEMALLKPSKETENKLRWSTYVEQDDTAFHLYIPKWRVPEPWPGRIYVGIEPFDGDPLTFASSANSIDELEKSIKALVQPVMEHTRTFRYAPLGEKRDWQIGEPYIPFSLIPPDSHILSVQVRWDLDSKGQFVDVPTYREDTIY